MTNPRAITAITSAAPDAPLVLRGGLPQCIRQAREWGYQAVEIHVIDAAAFPAEQVLAECEKQECRISAIVTGRIYTERGLCITSPDPDNRARAMEELRAYIDLAARLGVTDGVVIGWVKGKRPEEDAGFDQLLAGQLLDLDRYAGSQGQRLLIEVINRYETNLFNTAGELVEFIRTWKLKNSLVHLDSFHMNIDEADMVQAIDTAGELLGYFHVADSNRLAPGRGHLDFQALFSALQRNHYRGTISLECISKPDSLTTGAEGYAFLTKLLENC